MLANKSPFPPSDVKCNKCDWHGWEEDLRVGKDSVDIEEVTKNCPECETDNYLMDIEHD